MILLRQLLHCNQFYINFSLLLKISCAPKRVCATLLLSSEMLLGFYLFAILVHLALVLQLRSKLLMMLLTVQLLLDALISVLFRTQAICALMHLNFQLFHKLLCIDYNYYLKQDAISCSQHKISLSKMIRILMCMFF